MAVTVRTFDTVMATYMLHQARVTRSQNYMILAMEWPNTL